MDDESTLNRTLTAPANGSAGEPTTPRTALLLPHDQGHKKIRELALHQLNRFFSYEAQVLKGDDAEAIHDMRVASRRLQQVLDLLYPKPRTQELRKLRRQIRRSRQALGDVRNCDVLIEWVGRSLGRKRSARRDAWTAVQNFLVKRRSESFVRAMRKFGKMNLAVFYVNLKELLHRDKASEHTTEHHSHAADSPQTTFAGDLRGALQSTWNRFEDQVAQSHRHPRAEAVHAARIAAKRLRYLVEVFREIGVPGSADALASLRHLQKFLGDWHDLEVLEQMMIEMLARPDFLRDNLALAMQVEKLILRDRERKVDFEAKYSRMSWESTEMHRLKEWVAYFLASPSTGLAKA
jgi:CHAD domain-containing protein